MGAPVFIEISDPVAGLPYIADAEERA